MIPADFDFMRGFLKERTGLALTADKQYLLETRLLPVLRGHGFEAMSDLVSAVRKAPSSPLATLVAESMTTNETLFFRDKVPFDHFRSVIAPALLRTRAGQKRVRIWCAACSSGQEPYSLAIDLRERRPFPADWTVEILATDLSTAMLDKARAGLYSQFEVQRGMPIQLLVKYFSKSGENWQIAPAIRDMVTFQRVNLLDNFARLGTFDLVMCRNVLIYFERDTKIAVLEKLARQVAADGYLLLGAAETVVGVTDAFMPTAEHRGIYRPVPATACVAVPNAASPPLSPAAVMPAKIAVPGLGTP